MFDIEDPDTRKVGFNHNYWIDLYPDVEEAISSNSPVPMNNRKLRVSVMIDASHTLYLINRRSITRFIIVVVQTIVKWYSKIQNTL